MNLPKIGKLYFAKESGIHFWKDQTTTAHVKLIKDHPYFLTKIDKIESVEGYRGIMFILYFLVGIKEVQRAFTLSQAQRLFEEYKQ